MHTSTNACAYKCELPICNFNTGEFMIGHSTWITPLTGLEGAPTSTTGPSTGSGHCTGNLLDTDHSAVKCKLRLQQQLAKPHTILTLRTTSLVEEPDGSAGLQRLWICRIVWTTCSILVLIHPATDSDPSCFVKASATLLPLISARNAARARTMTPSCLDKQYIQSEMLEVWCML